MNAVVALVAMLALAAAAAAEASSSRGGLLPAGHNQAPPRDATCKPPPLQAKDAPGGLSPAPAAAGRRRRLSGALQAATTQGQLLSYTAPAGASTAVLCQSGVINTIQKPRWGALGAAACNATTSYKCAPGSNTPPTLRAISVQRPFCCSA